MTRILYWNIENFSMPKIQQATWPGSWDASQRLAYICTDVLGGGGGGIPDLIVIVEVYNRIREVGSEGTVLHPGRNAGRAVLHLLNAMRTDPVLGVPAGTDWCVVPPLNIGELGQREAVAVFYNAANLQFTGPNLFYQLYGPPGPVIGQSQPVNAATHAAIINYPAPWLGALPAARARSTAFPVGAAAVLVPEVQLAGEWQYYNAALGARAIPSPAPPAIPANRLHFPHARCRGPFYTRFIEPGGRTLNIFSVHTSPASAPAAVTALQAVPEITAVGAHQVNVLLGDFNVDTFGGGAGVYDGLIAGLGPGGIYQRELDPRAGHAGPVVPARRPYCMTHLLPTAQATPFNTTGVAPDPLHNVYPRYGYMGSSWRGLSDTGAIDNVLTAYGLGLARPAASNITVVNTLTGTPYNAFPAPAGVTAELTGGAAFASTLWAPNMLTSVPPAAAGMGGCADDGTAMAGFRKGIFQSWFSIGKVNSVSDHLPLMIDV